MKTKGSVLALIAIMKRISLLSFVFFCCFNIEIAAAQPTAQQTKNLVSYCKVWGFLKYYHPAIADGRLNWDSIFISFYPSIQTARSKAERDRVLLDLCDRAEAAKSDLKDPVYTNSGVIKSYINSDDWVGDSDLVSSQVSTALLSVKNSFRPRKNCYISHYPAGNPNIENDSSYFGITEPSVPVRFLALARYWNIINYYYPYKQIIGANWDSVLYDFIPKFNAALTTTEYNLAVLKLCNSIHDSHSSTYSLALKLYFGMYRIPLKISLIEGKTVITGAQGRSEVESDHILAQANLHRGDIILSVNEVEMPRVRSELRKFVDGSNINSIERNINSAILRGIGGITMAVDHNGAVDTIHLFFGKDLYLPEVIVDTQQAWKILNNNIGYVNMGKLTKETVQETMAALLTTHGIIFDVRNYPKNTMYLVDDYLMGKKPFAFFTIPMSTRPGALMSTERQMITCGEKEQFHGPIAILANEETQSHAEFTVMSLQQATRARTFGSQTAGADGNVSQVKLPGGITTMFTGLGVFYPDGTPTQRVGIKIDVQVRPTIAGIRAGRDEVLERAIQYINTGK